MAFPITVNAAIQLESQTVGRSVTLHGGLTVLLGPNGSGKTHLMRGLKHALQTHSAGKRVRFLSAGRVGLFEQYRSDFDGHRGGNPQYHGAQYGSLQDTARRHNYETLQGDFQTLAVRPDILIKIRERLRKLFSRDIIVLWDGGHLKIEFARTTTGARSYSSAREASGLLHLAGLLTALYDDEVGAVLIDEPEVSLHPQLQAFLLKEILSVAGEPSPGSNKKLVIIGTHSTEFLRVNSPKDIPSLVFCYDISKQPVQVAAEAGELRSTKLAALIARMGQEHKLAFFAMCPLLVEGPSDSIICGALCNKFDIQIEAGGSQLLPVIGKGQFPVVAKLLRMTGKVPLVLADADAIVDGLELANTYLRSEDANTRAAQVGSGSASELARSVYGTFCELIENHWSDIAPHAEQHAYWGLRDQADLDLAKVKRRAVFTTLLLLPATEVEKLDSEGRWTKMKHRWEFLLDLLESQGCFILRRGTIESYYDECGRDSPAADKPAAAATEASRIADAPENMLAERYADVLRCLRRAAQTQPIVEAESLQDPLLAVAAPALARIKNGASSDSLNPLARSIVGDTSKLFDLSVAEGKLRIDLKSQVLNVQGFPLEIAQDDDLIRYVSRALGTASA